MTELQRIEAQLDAVTRMLDRRAAKHWDDRCETLLAEKTELETAYRRQFRADEYGTAA